MFKVIGKDGKEYGPVAAYEVRAWIAQGRLDATSKAKAEGTEEWKPLREFPEFSDVIMNPPPVPQVPPAQVSPKTSGLAITSLVLGVLGLFTFGLTGIVGLVLGIVALVKINNNRGRLSGAGFAIAGMCCSGLMLLMVPVLAAMLLPALAKAKERAQTIQCFNQVKQLNLALMMYATDHRDTLPPADQWCDLIKPYSGASATVFHCPSEPPGRCSYGLNANVANKKLTDIGAPATTVLVFSSADGWNRSGNAGDATPHNHGRRSLTVGFADGHVESVRQERVSSLGW